MWAKVGRLELEGFPKEAPALLHLPSEGHLTHLRLKVPPP